MIMFTAVKFWAAYLFGYLLLLAVAFYRGFTLPKTTEELVIFGVIALVSTLVLAIISFILVLLWNSNRLIARFICLVIAAMVGLYLFFNLNWLVF